MFPKNPPPLESSIVETVLVAGGAHRICISGNDCELIVHNVHNFELHGARLSSLCDSVDKDIKAPKVDSLQFCVFLLGDFNLTPIDTKLFKYKSPCLTLDPALHLRHCTCKCVCVCVCVCLCVNAGLNSIKPEGGSVPIGVGGHLAPRRPCTCRHGGRGRAGQGRAGSTGRPAG